MLRVPGPPTTQDQARAPWGKLGQVHLDPGSHPSRTGHSQKITRATAPAESRMWLLLSGGRHLDTEVNEVYISLLPAPPDPEEEEEAVGVEP